MVKQKIHGAALQAYLSTGEAALILGVHHVAVRKMVIQGRLPGIQVARNWIIPRDALLEFAKSYVKGPGRRKPKAQKGANT